MRLLGIFSLIAWLIGAFAVLKGLGNEDVWILSLGILCWVISNFMEIMINRDMIRNPKRPRTEEGK